MVGFCFGPIHHPKIGSVAAKVQYRYRNNGLVFKLKSFSKNKRSFLVEGFSPEFKQGGGSFSVFMDDIIYSV
jgi:hypothetical protein